MTPSIVEKIYALGITTVDIGGRGGTSWPYIETLRKKTSFFQEPKDIFRDWGIPTAYSLAAIKSSIPKVETITTGGIRDGLTIAKACAMQTNMCGIGLPLLKAALISKEAVEDTIKRLIQELTVTMLATGSKNLSQLKKSLCYGSPFENEFGNYIRGLNATKN